MNPHSVEVSDAQARSFSPDLSGRIERAVVAALATGLVESSAPCTGEISVTLIDSAGIRGLNERFHDVDAPTDVLAFGLGQSGDGSPDTLVGDIYVCPDVAIESARDHDVDPEDEIVRLAIHGTLHLLGHDHPDGKDRYESDMFRLQERLVRAIG